MVSFLTGMQGIPLDRDLLHFSALVYIRLPLILGTLNKKVLIWKGDNWFNQQYRPIIGKIATVALLSTLVILFSLNGQELLQNFDKLLLASIPLLLGFVIVVGITSL